MSCMYACFGVSYFHAFTTFVADRPSQVGAMFSPLIIGGFIDAGYNWNVRRGLPAIWCS